jgi:ABC-type transport system involved in cytochrome c biogenesis ATPase subunit
MIGRLRLRNWRAYDQLDVELGPGATFVVASNGIGKTSLVMAAAWGIFGDIAGVRGADEIRGESDEATVTIDLHLPSSGALVITRTVDRRGRSTIEATLGPRTIDDQAELDVVLTDAFGADPRVLAQLTFMIHGGLHETQGEFELREHLAGVFGVRPLLDGAERAQAVAAETASELRKTKVVERKERRATDELVAELQTAEGDLRAAQEEREDAIAALNLATERLHAGAEWATYRQRLVERDAKLATYAEVAGSLLEREVDPAAVVDVLATWEADEERAVSELETRVATARGRADVVRESIERLTGAGADDGLCPTCLRPFAEHEAERAAEEHARQLSELEATIADGQQEATSRRELLTNLKGILADIRSVPVPLEPSSFDTSEDVAALQQSHDAARDEVQRIDQDVAMHVTAINVIRDEVAATEEDREQLERLEELYRLEAIAQAAAQTFGETADRIMGQLIEPLVEEVARRWKQTFGREGLQLSADGRITRRVGSRTLNFGALSGGERVWALLVARLLVAGASTRAPFIWLDEPLEHLDPRLRRIVAGTLAMASTNAGLRQVIVTTYEAPIAQQLMEDVPSASLIYVTSAG